MSSFGDMEFDTKNIDLLDGEVVVDMSVLKDLKPNAKYVLKMRKDRFIPIDKVRDKKPRMNYRKLLTKSSEETRDGLGAIILCLNEAPPDISGALAIAQNVSATCESNLKLLE